MFRHGNLLSDNDSEGTFVVRYCSHFIEGLFSDLGENIERKWGETWLYASTSRRNGDNLHGKRVKPGQKVDLIASVKWFAAELLLCEIAPPSTASHHVKWYNDRMRLITGMKDSLDFILRGRLNGLTSEDIKRIFVMGLQIAGSTVWVYVMNVSHQRMYMFSEVFKFDIPCGRGSFGDLKKALCGFLRIKDMVLWIYNTLQLKSNVDERSPLHGVEETTSTCQAFTHPTPPDFHPNYAPESSQLDCAPGGEDTEEA